MKHSLLIASICINVSPPQTTLRDSMLHRIQKESEHALRIASWGQVKSFCREKVLSGIPSDYLSFWLWTHERKIIFVKSENA